MELQPLKRIKSQQELFALYQQESPARKELKSSYETWYTEMKLKILSRLRELDQPISQLQINLLKLNPKYASDDYNCILTHYVSRFDMVRASLLGITGDRRFYGYDKISTQDKYEMIRLIRVELLTTHELDFDLIIINKPKKESINVYADISKKLVFV